MTLLEVRQGRVGQGRGGWRGWVTSAPPVGSAAAWRWRRPRDGEEALFLSPVGWRLDASGATAHAIHAPPPQAHIFPQSPDWPAEPAAIRRAVRLSASILGDPRRPLPPGTNREAAREDRGGSACVERRRDRIDTSRGEVLSYVNSVAVPRMWRERNFRGPGRGRGR